MSSSVSKLDLTSTARSLASRTDAILTRLTRMLSTAGGLDKTACTLQYTLIIISAQLSRLQGPRYRRFLLALSRKLSSPLLSSKTILATLTPSDSRLTRINAGCRTLSSGCSDFRTVMRLGGLLGIYAEGKREWMAPHPDKITNAIVWAQVVTIALYQVYENVAFLVLKGVLRGESLNETKVNRWYEISNRWWAANIALEVTRLLRLWQLDAASKSGAEPAEKNTAKAEAEALWNRQWAVNAAWAPVSYHYSWTQGSLSDDLIGVLGLFAGVTGFRHMWKQL